MSAARLALILSFSILWLFADKGQTFACSCVPPGSPSEAMARSAAVFVGRAETVSSSSDRVTVGFKVSTHWKGPSYEAMQLTTSRYGASCGFEFIEGQDYIVYSGDGSTVGLCSRTARLQNAQADLDELGEGRASQAGTVSPTGGGCILSSRSGSAGADAAWLGMMAGLVWLGLRRRSRS